MTRERPKHKDSGGYGLDFRLSRRDFFSALFREARALTGSLRGTPSYALAELPNLPEESMSLLMPRILAPWTIDADGEWLQARDPGTGQSIDLLPVEEGHLAAVKRFDGRTSLGSVGKSVAADMGWPDEEGFALARDLFLVLVGRRICLPGNAPEPQG